MSKTPAMRNEHYDIEFSVPQKHRLRFTRDCIGDDFHVLLDLVEASSDGNPRCQVWVDRGLSNWEPDFVAKVEERFRGAAGIELTRPVQQLVGGEEVKNSPQIVNRLLEAFDSDNLDRRSYVIVMGGGAVLDAVGYAAAIAHRGLRLIRLPTTTLAQGDSGVGVKNAVNWFGKKNWKGTFSTPWAVINDRRLLEGLSDRDFRCGFSEAVKVALLKDADFFRFLVEHSEEIASRQDEASHHALKQSVLLHLNHITRGGDPFESRQARPLDFGHWIAHKLEAVTDFRLRHGEAVAIGVAVDTAYSYLTQNLPLQVAEQTFAALRGLQLPIWDFSLNEEVIADGLEEFRQHLGGELTITLLQDAGKPVDVHHMKRSAILEAMEMVSYYADADVARKQAFVL